MTQHPSALRTLGASVSAAAAAAAPTILLGPLALFAFPLGFIIAGAHVIVLGIPGYLIAREYVAIDWAQAIIAGFVIGGVPLTIWTMFDSAEGGADAATLGGVLLLLGALGAIGGAVFRAVIGPPVERFGQEQTASIFE